MRADNQRDARLKKNRSRGTKTKGVSKMEIKTIGLKSWRSIPAEIYDDHVGRCYWCGNDIDDRQAISFPANLRGSKVNLHYCTPCGQLIRAMMD